MFILDKFEIEFVFSKLFLSKMVEGVSINLQGQFPSLNNCHITQSFFASEAEFFGILWMHSLNDNINRLFVILCRKNTYGMNKGIIRKMISMINTIIYLYLYYYDIIINVANGNY